MATEHPRIRAVPTKASTGLVASFWVQSRVGVLTNEVAGIHYRKRMEFSTPVIHAGHSYTPFLSVGKLNHRTRIKALAP